MSESYELNKPQSGIDNVAYNMDGESGYHQSHQPRFKDIDDKRPDYDDDDDDDLEDESNGCSRLVGRVQASFAGFFGKKANMIKNVFLFCLLIAFYVYVGFALAYEFGSEGSWRLLVCTIIGTLILAYQIFSAWRASRREDEDRHEQQAEDKPDSKLTACLEKSRFNLILKILFTIGFILFIILDVYDKQPRNLVSLSGMAFFIISLYIFSHNPSKVKWHSVFWGLAIQIAFALLILRTTPGYDAFKWLGDRIQEFLNNTNEGAAFVFGPKYVDFFAFAVLPVVIFFSAIVSVLYYLGVMQVLIKIIGKFLSWVLGTSPTESVNAAANIFIGQTEAPLLIRPFLKDMTNSEIHAVMTGGFATIAGAVMAAYIAKGVPANHLLSASVMSAPAALALSKLFYPETKKTKIDAKAVYTMAKGEERNIIEAAANGASMSISLVANIAVNLIAFVAILAFVDSTLVWFGDRVGYGELTFQNICSYVFWPISFLMGVDPSECRIVAELIGVKTFLNEFVAYSKLAVYIENQDALSKYLANFTLGDGNYSWVDGDIILGSGVTLVGGVLTERTVVISTYALCGFSNLASMGIQLGALGAMAPERKGDMSRIVFRAMIAGNAACFMTACIAGLFYTPQS